MAFVLMASIAIPYSAQTCLMSSQTNIQLLSKSEKCCKSEKQIILNETQLNKASCCIIDNGVLEIDVELVFSSLNSFIPYLPTQLFQFESRNDLIIPTKSIAPPIVAENSSYVPIRIMQQSFLC